VKASVAFLIALGAGVVGAAATAQPISSGEQLARQWCASCHLLPDQQVTHSVPQGPPSFRDIARTKTGKQIYTFLLSPHGAMPPLSLSRTEIDELIAYIESSR